MKFATLLTGFVLVAGIAGNTFAQCCGSTVVYYEPAQEVVYDSGFYSPPMWFEPGPVVYYDYVAHDPMPMVTEWPIDTSYAVDQTFESAAPIEYVFDSVVDFSPVEFTVADECCHCSCATDTIVETTDFTHEAVEAEVTTVGYEVIGEAIETDEVELDSVPVDSAPAESVEEAPIEEAPVEEAPVEEAEDLDATDISVESSI